ncbi:hypothetical protein O6H91_08G086500 [Diphasiastrum complanatum]|nr:hypothetical protein O6H91_08G086500 [Diphasiastrum complanatum]
MKTPPFASTPNEQKLQSTEVRDGSLSRTESKVKSNALDFGQEGKLTNLKPIWSIFGREAEKAKMVVETFVSRWLQGCLLLSGSLVLIPVCGRDCVFRIKEAQTVPEVSEEVETPTNSSNNSVASTLSSEEAITAKLGSLALSCPSQPAFYVSCRTAITLLPPFRKREDNNESQPCISLESSVCPSKAFEGKKLEVAGARNTKYPLGGLSEQISTLMEIIEFSLLRPHLLTRFGLQPTRGVLLYGPPGSGKTSLAHAAVSEAGVNILSVNGPEVVSEFYGESEKTLRAVFASAQLAAPCVVFIDELDAITPERKEGSEELAQRLVAELLSLMDGSMKQSLDRVLVIAATNRPEVIDPALRRPGRFDREIEVGVPTPAGRREILETLLLTMDHSLSVNDVESLAADTHGFVGADMAALCNEAAMTALRRYVEGIAAAKVLLEDPSMAQQEDAGVQKVCEGNSLTSQMSQFSDSLPTDKVATNKEKLPNVSCIVGNLEGSSEVSAESCGAFELSVNLEDFQAAKTKVRPSAMREVMLEIPKVKWHDIGGQDEVKQQLKEAVEWPQKHGDAFSRIGAQPPRGVLLYGPPGCSKTLMARAVATETGLNFIAVKGPELFSKWVGESEKAVRSLFARARAAAPSVVFFDEIDGLAVARNDGCGEGLSVGDRVLSQLLVELDGLIPRSSVAVIAATNRPDKIDAALLRPGRLDRLLYVGPPSEASRCQIFEIHLRQTPCRSDVQIEQLAAQTGGYTGADIAAVCREAAMTALEEDLSSQEVCMRHFEVALTRVQPSDPGFNCTFAAKFQRGFNTNE